MFTITPAAPADVQAIADVLAEAFQTDTVVAAATGRRRPDVPRLAAFFRPLVRAGALRHGRVDLARDTTDGSILGVALWEAPAAGSHLLTQAAELPAFLRALGLRGLLRAARSQAVLASFRPAAPHWYLAQIGVSARARGAGVGSALLASRLEALDATHEAAYLESSNERNRSLYLRNGFATIATIGGIPGVEPAGMWRAPNPDRLAAA